MDRKGNLETSETMQVNDCSRKLLEYRFNEAGLLNYKAINKSVRYDPGHQGKEKCHHPH